MTGAETRLGQFGSAFAKKLNHWAVGLRSHCGCCYTRSSKEQKSSSRKVSCHRFELGIIERKGTAGRAERKGEPRRIPERQLGKDLGVTSPPEVCLPTPYARFER